MKVNERRVAWIAALALAAMLAATPREGAAGPPGPYRMPTDPGPQLGDPDEPSVTTPTWWDQYHVSLGRLYIRLQQFAVRSGKAATARVQTSSATSRAAKHE